MVSDVDEARQSADQRVTRIENDESDWDRPRVQRGDEDPVLAVSDALATFAADEFLVVVHQPEDASHHERNLGIRLRERFGLPTKVRTVDSAGRIEGHLTDLAWPEV